MNALDNLATLNSATKYPEIKTYHELGDKGRLNEAVTSFAGGAVYFTEKVDGTNGRIVILPGGDYVIGSREHLLYARGDRVLNPAQSIVPTLKPLADELVSTSAFAVHSGARALYLEVYGGNVGGQAKQYTGSGNLGYRLFDIAEVDDEILGWERAQISAWREDGGQDFTAVTDLLALAKDSGIPTVPYIGHMLDGSNLPQTHQQTYDLLGRTIPVTRVGLDEGAKGAPEGLVLRNEDRTIIRKARFADYRRTLNIN